MATHGKHPNPDVPHKGWWDTIQHWFDKKEENRPITEDEFLLEPQYWPEVVDFIQDLNQLIEARTISDPNVNRINQRIVSYVEDQIILKGSIPDIEERYFALDTLADRVLFNNLSRLVGLKESTSNHPEFTEVVQNFKKRLHHRHSEEIAHFRQKFNKERHKGNGASEY